MRVQALTLTAVFLFGFGQRISAETEMYRSWQEFRIFAHATGFNNSGQVGDAKQATFATQFFGANGDAVSCTAPRCSANAGVLVWGWRTNIGGDTYYFNGSFSGAAAMLAASDTEVALSVSSHVGYSQFYAFSVSTTNGDPETVTIDVSQLGADAVLYAHLTRLRPSLESYLSTFHTAGSDQIILSDGDYRLEIRTDATAPLPIAGGPATGFAGSWSNSVRFSNLTPFPGWGPSNPVVKDPVNCRLCYDFRNIPKGTWVGAPAANEFSFQMIGSSLFTGIMSFPPGFTNQFEVVVGASSLGFFNANQPVDFVRLVGTAIPSFKIRNIAPLAEAGVTNTFPIVLNYDTDTADFVMLPNPGLAMFSETNGQARLFFAGTLVQSTNLVDWVDVPGLLASPHLVTPATSPVPLFFRARQQ